MTSSPRRVALITGAAQGIGSCIAKRLASDGFAVVLNDVESQKETAEHFAEELRKEGYTATVAIADVSNFDQVKAMVESLDRLDVMVANAGIGSIDFITDDHIDNWDRLMNVNAKGVLLCYKFAARKMIAQGGGGRIIGSTSVVGCRPQAGKISYGASKWAIRGLTQMAALELGKHNITVNCFAPGLIDSEATQQYIAMSEEVAEEAKNVINSSTLGRIGQPEEVASLVSYLASDQSSFMTGQTISIDGGIVYT
ncbi:acetoin reductase family protein [Flagelloscypha sp. PMI_526]|nr:acetoin reductase family protein [Flagelloscypha sp. PMI_526]